MLLLSATHVKIAAAVLIHSRQDEKEVMTRALVMDEMVDGLSDMTQKVAARSFRHK